MPQNRETGARASQYGHDMASKVAKHLGSKLLTTNSNEINYQGKRVVIKSARYAVPQVGVSKIMLERIQGVIAVLETKRDHYTMYYVDSNWYKKKMSHSKSKSPSAHKVMMVACKAIKQDGKRIGKLNKLEEPDSAIEVETIKAGLNLVKKIKDAIKAALSYEKATCDKRKLGITAEIGEILACNLLNLKLVLDTQSKGFDAIDEEGRLVQIKTRRSETIGMPRDAGRTSRFSKHRFDYALLVLLDHNYKLCEIWKAEYKELNLARTPHL